MASSFSSGSTAQADSVVAGFPHPIHDDTQRRPCVAPERDLPSADLGAQPL